MRLRAGRSIERMTNYGNQFLYAGSAISKHGTGEAQQGLRAEKAKTAFSPPATGRSAGGSAHSAGIGPEVQDGDSASGLRPALFGHIKETGAGTAFSAIPRGQGQYLLPEDGSPAPAIGPCGNDRKVSGFVKIAANFGREN